MRKIMLFLLTAAIALIPASGAFAQSCSNTQIVVPGAAGTSPAGVNKYDTVVGVSLDNSTFQLRAFRWHGGSITTYSYPNAVNTQFSGINDLGAIAGSYADSAGDHGLILHQGQAFTFNYPKAASTLATGINTSGVITGFYFATTASNSTGFYRTSGGAFHSLTFPGSVATVPKAISDNGVIAGFYDLADHSSHGFTYANGAFHAINFPGAASTEIHGINKYGTVVGLYRLSLSGSAIGFTRYNDGTFASFIYTNSSSTTLDGISNLGDRAGSAVQAHSEPGFLRICR